MPGSRITATEAFFEEQCAMTAADVNELDELSLGRLAPVSADE